jgi:hypothetical protein
MARPKRSLASRRPDRATEALRAEVEQLREIVAALRAESAAHIRRFGELQLELDRMKSASAPAAARSAKRVEDGAA